MATANLRFSYAASKNIPELFASMFPDSKIAADYAMKDRKLSYVISHGTGHFLLRELVKDVNKAPSYSLFFDETTIVGVRKQLDLHIRYWSESKQGVVTRYWKSNMLGHATAEIIARNILDSLKSDGIDLCRDNPNVNKSVEALIDKELRSEREEKSSAHREDYLNVEESVGDGVGRFMKRFVVTRWGVG
ncbi:unnamed protein product, partial [Rotaria sp. Silwood1]